MGSKSAVRMLGVCLDDGSEYLQRRVSLGYNTDVKPSPVCRRRQIWSHAFAKRLADFASGFDYRFSRPQTCSSAAFAFAFISTLEVFRRGRILWVLILKIWRLSENVRWSLGATARWSKKVLTRWQNSLNMTAWKAHYNDKLMIVYSFRSVFIIVISLCAFLVLEEVFMTSL